MRAADGLLRILLVEDSETDAYAIKRIFSRNMMRRPSIVRHVRSMAEAEKALGDEDRIDLILLDLGLPDTGDNKDTFHRLQAVKGDRPVVILTSVADHDLAISIIDKGAEDYVRKSVITVNPEVLSDAVDFAMSRHKKVEGIKEKKDQELQEKDQVIKWMSGDYSVMR